VPARFRCARRFRQTDVRRACTATSTRSTTGRGAITFTMLVSSSYRRDAWHALCVSAAQYGYEVLPPQAV
jgi:hypothetical protein